MKRMILGIETSCDETATALIGFEEHLPCGEILSSEVLSQQQTHIAFGGVVPELAARDHLSALKPLLDKTLKQAQKTLQDCDGIAVTAGPGLVGALMVGLIWGKALSFALGKPLLCVNHLEAHALTCRLIKDIPFPYLLLLISGGHCQLLCVENVGHYELYGTTLDDAAGEAFDKVARLLGLGYPGGPAIEALALKADVKQANDIKLPRPMQGKKHCDFSFAGLKTACLTKWKNTRIKDEKTKAAFCLAFQQAILDCLIEKSKYAMEHFVKTQNHKSKTPHQHQNQHQQQHKNQHQHQHKHQHKNQHKHQQKHQQKHQFVVAGGVASNQTIRQALEKLAQKHQFDFYVAPKELCTDNAAMVGWAGCEKYRQGAFSSFAHPAKPRWNLDELNIQDI